MTPANENIKTKPAFSAWSFRLFIYLIVINAFAFWDTIHAGYGEQMWRFYLLRILAAIFFFMGITMTIMAYFNKETATYQFKVSAWGYGIYIVVTAAAIMYIRLMLFPDPS